MKILLLIKKAWGVFISKSKLLFGLEPITFIGFFILLLLDLLADLINDPKVTRMKQFVFNIFFYFAILFVLNSFTFQFPLIFTAIFNSIFTIFILDNLFNLFKTLSETTKESTFNEITKYMKDFIKGYIEKLNKKDISKENTNEIKPEEKDGNTID